MLTTSSALAKASLGLLVVGVSTTAVLAAFHMNSQDPVAVGVSAPGTSGTIITGGSSNAATKPNSGSNGNANGHATFTLAKAAVPAPGLVLGVPNSLPVTVTNPASNKDKIKMTVDSITVSVTSSPAGCPASTNLSITNFDRTAPGARQVVLATGESATINVPITLVDRDVDQTACRGKTFALALVGNATVTK